MRLAPVFIGSLARRRLTTLFSFAAIALGVALGMAVDAVHQAALDEFTRGLARISGDADLSVVGPRSGFAEAIYAQLAGRAEVAEASPMIEVDAQLDGRNVRLLGVDVLALARVTPALLPRPADGADRLAVLREDALFANAAAQRALGARVGEAVELQAGTRTDTLTVAGDVPGVEANQALALMDIASVQTRFALLGKLTRIDLRLRAGVAAEDARRALQQILPPGVVIEAPQEAQGQAARLSRAYRVNLTLLAAMALLTGVFLVFSGQALSVVRRRSEFAFLRAIGLSRRRLTAWLVGEGALLGLAGGIVGVAAGYALAALLLALRGGDLGAGYFAGLAPRLHFDALSAASYVALGVLAGAAGAWLPAHEAATVSPAQALKAADGGASVALPGGRGRPRIGALLLAASLPACALPPIDGLPLGGYLAIACLLAGSVALLPLAAAVATRLLPPSAPVGVRLARARLVAAPGHALVAAAGVLTSVALAAAMAIMVASFRDSVDAWLTQVLPADLYLRAGPVHSGGGFLDEAVQACVGRAPGVAGVAFSRLESVRLAAGRAPVTLIARPLAADGAGLPLVASAPARGGGQATGVWISEALHDLYGWQAGQRIELPLAGRTVDARVAGVWRDYARQTGALLIDLTDYRQLTGDQLANDAAITLAAHAAPSAVAAAVQACAPAGTLEVAYPAQIRATSLRIFDRTFAVTYLLEAVAVIIGLAGVAASFAALAAARQREFGMLRHLGLTRRQVAAMLACEGALAAGVGVLGGLAAGGAIAYVLIDVVNRQSFHWSMNLYVPWASLALFAVTLTTLAALAALAAGRQAMRVDAVLAVREDW